MARPLEGNMKLPHRRKFLHLAAGAAALPVSATQAIRKAAAQSVAAGAREIPARSLPVPEHVSPQMQVLINRPVNPRHNLSPQTAAEWKTIVEDAARPIVAGLPKLRETLGVTVEPTTIAGVKAFIVTPKLIPPENRERVLLHLHGGFR